jgi:uncharacterized protein (TIGR03118 family)
MRVPSYLRKQRAAANRQRSYLPALEYLEDRCPLTGGFAQVNLVSDVPGLAAVTDPNLVNPWGLAFSPTGPFWSANNGSGVSDLFDGRGQPLPLVVTVPSAAPSGNTPTGTVFNGGPGFAIWENGVAAPSRFLFATQDGTIAGWTTVVDPTHALVAVDNSSSGADYTGLALATDPAGHSFLYAADFSHGTIDVFDQNFQPVVHPASFEDPNLPQGYTPFNIQNVNNLLFVTYAQQDENGRDVVAGAGHGFIDVYDTAGNLVSRFASGGPLNAPWGLALAAADFGPFGGALLVGNNGDGHINAYDPWSGAFLGQLAPDNGTPIAIPNLWALTFGNGHVGGDSQTLFFTAGVDYAAHGLFGAIQAPDRRGADTAGSGAFDPNAPGEVGDYPLPPSAGPAFRADVTGQPLPSAELLPLTDSSLALAPTLSPFVQPSTRVESVAAATTTWGVSLGGPALTAVPPSSAALLVPAEEQSPAESGARHAAVPLSAFLDVNALQTLPPKQVGVQWAGPNPHATGVGSSAFADRDAAAPGLLAKAHFEEPEAPSGEKTATAAPPAPGAAWEGRASAPSQSSAESGVEPAAAGPPVETRDRRSWIKMVYSLFITGIPVIWTYWARSPAKAPQSRRRRAGSSE